jgi:diguanylate cyclase (GGDEF)-like protein/PAS domain S-box-containing protein
LKTVRSDFSLRRPRAEPEALPSQASTVGKTRRTTLGRKYGAIAAALALLIGPLFVVVITHVHADFRRTEHVLEAMADLQALASQIDGLQTERGLTLIWRHSQDASTARRLAEQRREVSELRRSFLDPLASHSDTQAVAPLIQAHRNGDERLARLRFLTDQRAAPADAVFDQYSALIQDAINQGAVIATALPANDELVSWLQAYRGLEFAKEFAGVERAHVAAWLTRRGRLEAGEQRHWKMMISRQQAAIEGTLTAGAPPAIHAAIVDVAGTGVTRAIERLRGLIATGKTVSAEEWFEAASRYMDQLHDLGIASLEGIAEVSERHVARHRIATAALIALLIGTAALFAFLVAFTLRGVVRPLRELHGVATGLERDPDGALRARPRTSDEIGALATAFNRMVEAGQGARRALAASEQRYAMLVEQSLVGVCQIEDGRFTYVNPRFAEIFGYDIAELLSAPVLSLVAPEEREQVAARMEQGLWDRGPETTFTFTGVCAKGRRISIETYGTTIVQDGRALAIVMCQDVSERHRAEQETMLAAAVFDVSRQGIVITDTGRRIVRVNPAFETITGYTAAEAIGKSPQELLKSGRQDNEFYATMWRAISTYGHWEGEIWNRRKNGELYAEWLSVDAVRGADGAIVRYVGVFTDLTRQKELDARVRELSLYDPLTNLPNRRFILDHLEEALARAKREGTALAVLFLDLDRFKNINDTLGHQVGDECLRQTADRLRNALRSGHDGRAPDTVGRLGGDEFVAVVAGLRGANDAPAAATSILRRFTDPLIVQGQPFRITVSIGISMFPNDADTAGTLLRHADLALYQAKRAGRNNFRFYTADLETRVQSHVWIENNVPRALAREELELHYQPQVRIATGQTVGAEALLRWRHPERGMIPPAEFVPVLEETGLIEEVGVWVLERACRDLAEWRARRLVAEDFRVAVNLSGRQLHDPRFPELVTEALGRHRLPPGCLELELTESVVMEHAEAADEAIARLAATGIRLAIDDFGTGHSSLARLHRFGFHRLKIDRTFVAEIADDAASRSIVRATIALAHGLGLEALAEGVETAQELEFLRQHGCDAFQGFLAARPLPSREIEPHLGAVPGAETQSN